MLALRTSEEFARWFAALDQATAEDVAATLEVVAQLAPEKEAPRSSEWLTWYEHGSVSGRLVALREHPAVHVNPAIAGFVQEWGVFSGYVRRAVKHLESPAFVARLKHLDDDRAVVVANAVVRIRRARTKRALAVSDAYRKLQHFGGQPTLSPRDEAALLALADVQEIRDAYFDALGAAGFERAELPVAGPALREIGLRTPPPGIRLLYGIDPARGRGLVVLGERFDRSFYGQSVRLAEQRWREFLEAEDEERPSP